MTQLWCLTQMTNLYQLVNTGGGNGERMHHRNRARLESTGKLRGKGGNNTIVNNHISYRIRQPWPDLINYSTVYPDFQNKRKKARWKAETTEEIYLKWLRNRRGIQTLETGRNMTANICSINLLLSLPGRFLMPPTGLLVLFLKTNLTDGSPIL